MVQIGPIWLIFSIVCKNNLFQKSDNYNRLGWFWKKIPILSDFENLWLSKNDCNIPINAVHCATFYIEIIFIAPFLHQFETSLFVQWMLNISQMSPNLTIIAMLKNFHRTCLIHVKWQASLSLKTFAFQKSAISPQKS